ncbi:MAG: HD domain-containing protein [Planctomycetota bacterium]
MRALEFAATKHAGHKRKNGDNYIIHPIRVSQEVFTEKQKAIALLHDTLEDTGTTLEELTEQFGDEIAASVEVLTHRKGESYADYIQRVKKDPDATAVKISDIADNLNDSPSENAIKKGALGITTLLS